MGSLSSVSSSTPADQDRPSVGAFGVALGGNNQQDSYGSRSPHAAPTRARPGAGAYRTYQLATPSSRDYDRGRRLDSLCRALGEGRVYVLNHDGQLIPTEVWDMRQSPQRILSAWAAEWLPGDGDVALRLAERIGNTDLDSVTVHSFDSPVEPAGPFASLASFQSFASTEASPQLISRAPEAADTCFVVLRSSHELRLAVYAVLRPPGPVASCAWRLRVLTGNALAGCDASVGYTIDDLPETSCKDSSTSARELLYDDLESLTHAVTKGEFRGLGLGN